MTLQQTSIHIAVSLIVGSYAFNSYAVDIQNIEEFDDYLVDNEGYYLVEVDDQTSGNEYEIELGETTTLKGLQLVTAFDESEHQTTVENNKLTWISGNIGSSDQQTDVFLYAAFSKYADVKNNTLVIESGTFAPKFQLESSYGDTFGRIVAGRTENGDLSNNQVTISGGTFYGNIEVIGAYSTPDSERFQKAENNSVTLEGQNILFRPYEGQELNVPGEHLANLYGAKMELADVTANSVTIKNLEKSLFNYVVGGYSYTGTVSDNSVSISDCTEIIANWIFAGQSYSDDDYVIANHNNIDIQKSSVTFTMIAGAENSAGGVTNSVINIANSTLLSMNTEKDPEENVSTVTGGVSFDGGSYSVSNNTIHLTDVKVETYGKGFMKIVAGGNYATTADVFNNRIVIDSTDDVFNEKDLKQADFFGSETYGKSYNNSLILNRWRGSVKSIQNFDQIIFQNFAWEKGSTLLEVEDVTSITNAEITVNAESIKFSDRLENHFGEQMTLIKGETGIQFNPFYDNGQEVAIPSTITQDAIGIIQNNRDDDSVDFKLQGTAPSQQLELVSNNRNMSLFFVNHGAELILDNLDATSRDYHWGLRTFASIDGVQSNYSTDGHIDVHGFTAAAGLANSVMLNGNPLLLNLFVETGKGDYTEEMSYLNIDRRFSGDVKYYGAGISARIKNTTGWYAEGSLRAGKTETEVSRGLVDGNGVDHGYDLSSNYFGVHVGAGRIIDVGENMKADFFMKYFYTYLPSDSTDIFADGVNNQFDFDSVGSSRIRVGGRLYFPLQNSFWAYTGLAYQYDFTPDVHVEANGEKIADAASMRGSMGIGSLGLRYKSEDSPWVVDLKIRGYVGQREGVSGKAQVEYRY